MGPSVSAAAVVVVYTVHCIQHGKVDILNNLYQTDKCGLWAGVSSYGKTYLIF